MRLSSFVKRKAFTLIELLVVIAIIGIISAVAIPNYIQMVNGAKYEKMKADMENLKKAVRNYVMRLGSYPTDLKMLKGSFLNELPKTPWGGDYNIRAEDLRDERGNLWTVYVIYCNTPKGEFRTLCGRVRK